MRLGSAWDTLQRHFKPPARPSRGPPGFGIRFEGPLYGFDLNELMIGEGDNHPQAPRPDLGNSFEYRRTFAFCKYTSSL